MRVRDRDRDNNSICGPSRDPAHDLLSGHEFVRCRDTTCVTALIIIVFTRSPFHHTDRIRKYADVKNRDRATERTQPLEPERDTEYGCVLTRLLERERKPLRVCAHDRKNDRDRTIEPCAVFS